MNSHPNRPSSRPVFASCRVAAAALAGLAILSAASPVRAQAQEDPFTDPVNGVRHVDPGWHALSNATVHVGPGEVIEGGTVVVRDGMIVAVLDQDGAPAGGGDGEHGIPGGARVWDCTGLELYPGLIDPWVEVDAPRPDPADPGAHWNARVTPQRRARDGAGIDKATAEALREMGFAAAAMSPEGGIFRGSGALVSLAAAGDPIEGSGPEMRRRVYRDGVYQAMGFDTRGAGGERGYPDSQGGAIALIRQTLSDADYYEAQPARSMADPNCLLALSRAGEPLLAFDVDDELEALRATRIAREFDRPALIVGSGLEFRRLEAIAEDGAPVIVPLNFPEAPKVASIGDAEAVDLRELMTWEQAPTNPRRLEAAGLKVAMTTSKLKKRGDFAANLRKAIVFGLKEEDALAMLTTTPAALLGVQDQMGTLEAGKVANIVVADGPLFAKKTVVRDVWIDGQRHEVNPAPPVDLSGTWVVSVEPPVSGSALAMKVKHDPTGRAGKTPKITLTETTTDASGQPKEASSEAKNVVLAGDALSFTFDHEPFGGSGVFVTSGVIDQAATPLTIRFDAMTSAGEMFRWMAVRGDAEPADSEASSDVADAHASVESAEKDDQADKKDSGAREGAEDKSEELRQLAADVPEEYGYPFGAYAMDETPPQRTVVFRHATIWTCGPQGVIQDGAMGIEGGKVAWVAPDDGRTFPAGAEIIDVGGRNLTPGVIDCHSHTGLFEGGVNEGGQQVTAEVRMGDITNPDTISWYRQLAGGVTVANQLHGSANPIGGQSQTVKNRWGCVRPEDMHMEGAVPGIKFALGENVKRSNGYRDQTRYPATRMGVDTLIRDRFTAAREYAAAMKAGSAAARDSHGHEYRPVPPRRDLELEALAEVLAGKRLVHCHSYRQDEILMLCRVAGDFGFRIGTFQHILEGYKVAEAIRENAIGASTFSDWWAYKVEVQDAIPYNGAIMHDVGIPVSFNSDSDELARRLNSEAGKAIKYGGLSPEEALKFVTLNPAIQLGIADRVGSLEPGKDADFVIWSGDPLSAMTRAEATWIDGREYFSLEQDRAHREHIQAERARIIQKILGAKKGKQEPEDKPEFAPEPEDKPVLKTPPQDAAAQRRRDEIREHFLERLNEGATLESAVCGDCGATAEMTR